MLEVQEGGFPIEVFPHDLQRLFSDYINVKRQPLESCTMAALFIASTASGTNRRLLWKGFKNYPQFWGLLVGRTGTGKSVPMKDFGAYLDRADNDSHGQYKEAFEAYSGTGEKPIWRNHIIRSATMEKVIERLSQGPVGWYGNEFAGTLKSFTKYRAGDDIEQLLQIFDNDKITQETKFERSRNIENPCLAMYGSLQPDILGIMGKNSLAEKGFTFRFLYCTAKRITPVFGDCDKDINRNLMRRWEKCLKRIMSLTPMDIRYSPDALKVYGDWFDSQYAPAFPEEDEGIDDPIEQAILSKLIIHLNRLAVLLQLIYYGYGDGENNTIEGHIMTKAVLLIDYFYIEAIKVSNTIVNPSGTSHFSAKESKFFSCLPYDEFSLRLATAIVKSSGLTTKGDEAARKMAQRFLARGEGKFTKNVSHGIYKRFSESDEIKLKVA